MGYTALHDNLCKSVHIADMTDRDPELTALWVYIMAAGAPWGRLPAHVKLFKARVCPLVDRWTGAALDALVGQLVDSGLLTRYTCERTGLECLAITNYSRYNSAGRQYHRMSRPEFGPPPEWVPPKDLLDYLAKVAAGAFKRQQLREEAEKFGVDCAKFGLSTSTAPRDLLPGTYSQGLTPKDVTGTETQKETETETETETEQRLTTPSPTTGDNGAPCAHLVSAQGANGRATARSPAPKPELDDDALFEQVNGKRPKDVSERAAWDTCKEKWLTNKPLVYPGGEIKYGWGNYKFPNRPANGRPAAAGSAG